MTLNHLHIGSTNLEKSQNFYKTFFGFKKKFSHGDKGVFLEDDKGFLMAIDEYDIVEPFPSWFHIGYCLDSKEQVKNIYDNMLKNDIKILKDYEEYGDEAAAFYAYDPDGNKIEVSWHKD